MSQQGKLVDQVLGGRRWVDRDSIRALLEDRASWLSYTDAADLVGCSRARISSAVKSGEIEGRSKSRPKVASLSRSSVEAFAARWAEEQRVVEERRRARPAWAHPDDGQVWLDLTTTSLVLGLTRGGVRYLAAVDKLPHQRRSNRLWFRRDHVEQAAAARALYRARKLENPSS